MARDTTQELKENLGNNEKTYVIKSGKMTIKIM